MSTITFGVDLAKSVFSLCEVDGSGRVPRRQDLRREAFVVWLAQVPAGTVIAMEACSGSHHWARRCLEHGLQPRLMAAQLVKPYRKSQHGKSDRNGRQLSAWLGMKPSQYSSGGHPRLGGISCRGDGHLRTLLIQGARSSLQRAKAVATEKATLDSCGYARWPHDSRSAKCWSRSRTNMHANYG